jgi:hypothetical protein
MFFQNRIKNDFDKAHYITFEPDELIINKGNNNIVRCILGNDYLILNSNNKMDTLKVKIEDYFIEYLNEDSRLISNFYLKLNYNNNTFPLVFEKEYSRKVLFRNESL